MTEHTGGSVESMEADIVTANAQLGEAVVLLKRVLEYITHPSMGLPSGVDPAEFAMDGATEANVRTALRTCILMAREALTAPHTGREVDR